MKISILVPCKNIADTEELQTSLKQLDTKDVSLEIILCEGNNPSRQRNLLAEISQGDWILFLDDDSIPQLDILQVYKDTMMRWPSLDVAGGPSLLFKEKNLLNDLSNIFFSSRAGIGPLLSRYNKVGEIRSSNERELILCNLLIRKRFFLKTKGFRKDLYPGEENEFLNRAQGGGNVLYTPNAIVRRHPRKTSKAFLLQMFFYGKGRARHLAFKNDYMFLLPACFVIYLFFSAFIFGFAKLSLSPLVLYYIVLALRIFFLKNQSLLVKFIGPLFFFFAHIFYGAGLIVGLFSRFIWKSKQARFEHKIQTIKSFG